MSQLINYILRFGRFQRNARLYLYSVILSGISAGIILVLYNLYLSSLGYKTDFIGLVLFVGTIGGGLAIFPAGLVVDRLGGKQIMIWASVVIGIASTGQLLFRTPIPLLLSTFIVGLGGAFILVVMAPFLSTNSTPEERPHLFSMNIVLGLGTSVIGSAVGGILPTWFLSLNFLMGPLPPWLNILFASQPETRAYQLAMLFAGAIAAPSFIPLFLMDDDRPTQRRQISSAEKISLYQLLRTVFTTMTQRGQNWMRQTTETFRRQPVREWCRHPIVVISTTQALVGLGSGLFIPYFNLYFVEHLGATPALYGLLGGTANLAYALGAFLAPGFVARIGRVATITFPRLLSVPLMVILGLTTFLPLAAVLYPVRQGLNNMAQGIAQLFIMEKVAPEHRGLANSSYETAFWVARACGAPIGGLMITYFGFTPSFLIAAVLYVIAMALFWLRFRHDSEPYQTLGQEQEEGRKSNQPHFTK